MFLNLSFDGPTNFDDSMTKNSRYEEILRRKAVIYLVLS